MHVILYLAVCLWNFFVKIKESLVVQGSPKIPFITFDMLWELNVLSVEHIDTCRLIIMKYITHTQPP